MDGHQYTARFEAPGGEPLLEAYLDTLGIPTIGLGHTGPEVHLGLKWTREKCFSVYYNDYAIAAGHVPRVIGVGVFSALTEPRKAVMIDMCFNPGPTRFATFHHMLDAIFLKDWQKAHDELLDSKYAMHEMLVG